jgi:UDPglucose 6-dehydrogenase
MNICIVGTGYVGLVTGTCLAEIGHRVICVDSNKDKIETLKKGKCPIYEQGLHGLITKHRKAKRLQFTTSISEGVKSSSVIFIAVHTPPKPDGKADLSFLAGVSREIAEVMDGYRVIVDKSTVPVETGEKVAATIKRYNKHNVDFDVASNPEFLREGSAVSDFMHPDRIILGVTSKRAAKLLKDVYKPLKARTIVTDIKSAEIIKHACNSFLALKISFANAIARICEQAGANVEEVVEGMGYDKRIGREFLNAGIGYGGSCFPKDVAAFIQIAEELGYDFKLLKAVEDVNKRQRNHFLKKVEETLWVLGDKTIGVLGLSFKPNTDDMRNAPSVDIIKHLQKGGARIRAYDPKAVEPSKKIFKGVTYCKDPYETAQNCDALLILTEWDEFRGLKFSKIRSLMASPIVIDGRNMYDPATMEEAGFIYKSIGRADKNGKY